LGLLIAVPVTLVLGVREWRKSSAFWFMPFLACLAFGTSPMIIGPLRGELAERQFKQDLDSYNRFIESVNSGAIPTAPGWSNIDRKYFERQLPSGVMRVMAARNSEKIIVVEFYSVSSSLAHSGFLYKNYDDNDNAVPSKLKPEDGLRLQHISGKWYSFSD
jgi:hypothetical protein